MIGFAVEESDASVREKQQRQATRLLFGQKVQGGVDQFPKFGRVKVISVYVTNYASKPAIFVQSCPVSVEITAERIPGTSFVICSNQSRCQKNTG